MHTSNTVYLQSPQFRVLSPSQLENLHLAALEILRRTGMRFRHAEALDMLRQAGAFIEDGDRVRFPERLVKEALDTAPSRVMMCDRNGQPAVALEGRKVWFGTGSDCLYLLDPRTGEHRPFQQADLVEAYHLVDALPNISFLMSVGIPADIDPRLTYDVQMAMMLEHTTKPIVFVTNDGPSCRRAIAMAAAAVGGEEALRAGAHILLYSEPSSPLQQSETAIDKLLLMAEYELPVVHSPAPQMGALAPITLAGGLAQSLAEILASLTLHQLKRPGAPFIFGAGV
ncbi:MAG TPA: trimethylamine methyltransferase family protein, partial [Anaerolineales bacterium]|nr:trimethylamine methyltransferase family protein [Anaerolineales bacterium]